MGVFPFRERDLGRGEFSAALCLGGGAVKHAATPGHTYAGTGRENEEGRGGRRRGKGEGRQIDGERKSGTLKEALSPWGLGKTR